MHSLISDGDEYTARKEAGPSVLVVLFTHATLLTTVVVTYIAVLQWSNPADKMMPDGGPATDAYAYQYHPVLMVTAFVLFMSEGVLAYRLMPFEHRIQKRIHGVCMLVAATCASVGLYMMVHLKNVNQMDHFSNPHALLGIITISLFFLQFLVGFSFFSLSWLFPSFPSEWRAMAMPFHRFVGVLLFFCTFAALLTGFMCRADDLEGQIKAYTPEFNTFNAASMLVVLSGVVILFHFSPLAGTNNAGPTHQRLMLPHER